MNKFVATQLVIAGLLVLPGCSVFQGSRALDMNPFAENTSLMFAEAAKVARPPVWNHLKPYYDIPELGVVRERAEPVLRGLRRVVMYSNQIVALNMASKSDREKNRILASRLREATGNIATRAQLDSIGISSASLDTVFRNIEQAETFLGGISAASPVVNAIVLALIARLDELDATLPVVIAAVDRAIDRDYRDARRNYAELIQVQSLSLRAVGLLYKGQTGQAEALDTLLRIDPSMIQFIPSPEKASPDQLRKADQALYDRLVRIDTFIHQLDNEKAVFMAKQQELMELRVNVDTRIKLARDAVNVWAQSHRNLGAGIPVPPMVDVAGIAGGLARKVVPLP